MRLNDGKTHRILFSNDKLYLDGIQIAGEGMELSKDVLFEFEVNNSTEAIKDSSEDLLGTHTTIPVGEVDVHDSIKGKDLGPVQSKK